MKNLTVFIICFTMIINAYCQTAEENKNSGLEKYKQQDLNGAFSDFNKAIELDPVCFEAYLK